MTKDFLETTSWNIFEKQVSKIKGRHNYSIIIDRVSKKVYVGFKKAMRETGISEPFLWEIREARLLFAAFTYKTDLNVLIDFLKKNNYQINWI